MKSEQWPLTESPFSHAEWPGNGCVALVLDGTSVPSIEQTIYEWANGPVNVECLYALTRWEPVSEFAPWVVWLNGASDPVVSQFIEKGAHNEWGYILVSEHQPELLRDYLRQLITIERAPGSVELVRMAHPELARSLIGEGLISPKAAHPFPIVRQLISPDRVSGTWISQEPPRRPEGVTAPHSSDASEALDAVFLAFNRRRDNLLLWDLLDQSVRQWLGGPSISEAFPKLTMLTHDAERQGHRSPRDKLRFLLCQYDADQHADTSVSNV